MVKLVILEVGKKNKSLIYKQQIFVITFIKLFYLKLENIYIIIDSF